MASLSSTPSIDLESWAARYEGEARLRRLLFWAHHESCTPSQQALAIKLAQDYVRKTGGHTHLYDKIFPAGSNAAVWMQQQQQQQEAQLQLLEARLSAAQSNLHKEAIRTAHLNLAHFHRQRGGLQEALQSVLKSRDYCTSRTQTGQVCLLVVELSLDLQNWKQVRDYVQKAQHATVTPNDTIKLHVASGLSHLAEGNYKEAATSFQKVTVPPTEWRIMMAPEDVSLYTALLALSELSRPQLVSFLQTTSSTLELVPPLQQALQYFGKADYNACWNLLQEYKTTLDLDYYLHPHLANLLSRIRDRSVVDYVQPYSHVSISTLANGILMTPPGHHAEPQETPEATLARLIGTGRLPPDMRLDLRTGSLRRNSGKMDRRWLATQKQVLQLQESVLRDAQALMIRLACYENHGSGAGGGMPGPGGEGPRVSLTDEGDLQGGVVGWSDDDDDDVPMMDMVNPEEGEEERDLY